MFIYYNKDNYTIPVKKIIRLYTNATYINYPKMKEIRKELFKARRLYKNEKFDEALEIFDRHYKNHPELFHIGFRTSYAWAIYKRYAMNFKSDEILFKSVERITEITSQQDLNKEDVCIYTIAVLKVIRHLKRQQDYHSLPYWLEKLDPMLLRDVQTENDGRTKQSDREYYFEVASMAYYNCWDYERCADVTKAALDSVENFVGKSETYHKWRLGKSLRETNRPFEALEYLTEIADIAGDWFIYNEIAEIYFRLGKPDMALDYLCPAVLSDEPLSSKFKIYHLIFKILNERNSDWALMHGQLYYILMREKGYDVPYDIETLGLDDAELDKSEILNQIHEVWTQYRFKDQKLQHGTVSKFFTDRNYGFITTENDASIFFHKDEFEGDMVHIGQLVSFYTESSFDNVKNEKSVKAVYVRGE